MEKITMLKPVGSGILVKIEKEKVKIELMPGSTAASPKPREAIVAAVGTATAFGLKVGHSVMFHEGIKPTLIEETDDYSLISVDERQILFIKNWEDIA